MTESFKGFGRASGAMVALAIVLVTVLMGPVAAWAQQPAPAAPAAQAAPEGARRGGEANLILPDLGQVTVGGYDSRSAADRLVVPSAHRLRRSSLPAEIRPCTARCAIPS
jgi:hypothetical protein